MVQIFELDREYPVCSPPITIKSFLQIGVCVLLKTVTRKRKISENSHLIFRLYTTRNRIPQDFGQPKMSLY